MKAFFKPILVATVLIIMTALSSCSLGQAAAPTATPVDVNAVMTSAAATAFVQLTQIAGQASPTSAPTSTSAPTETQSTTQSPALLLTPTVATTGGAAGLPAVETPTLAAGLPAATPAASVTPILPLAGSTTVVSTCFNSKFVVDVTILDGTVLKPTERFRKVWRIQNTGTCAWDEGFGLVFLMGEAMGGQAIYFSGRDNKVQPGGTVDLGIDMKAPAAAGEHIGHWIMVSDQGKTFGGGFTVVIKVSK
jgi:hypothetical protein